MDRLLLLYKGETLRMRRYGISGASLATAILLVLMVQFSGLPDIRVVFPLALFIDTTLMSLLLAGVTMIFENQENALGSMLTLPISKDQYLVAKSLAISTSAVTTLVLMLVYGIAFRGMQVHIPGMLGAVVLVSFAFAQIGIIMTYYARDFTDLLMGMFKFSMLFAVPTLLEQFGIIEGYWVKLVQYANPTKNALLLIQAPIMEVEGVDLGVAVTYTAIMGAVLYWMSRGLFEGYAAKGGA